MDKGNERDKHGQEVSWTIYKGSRQRAWLPLRPTHPGRVKTHAQANIQCSKRRLHLPRNVAVVPRSNFTAFAKKTKKKTLYHTIRRTGINLYSQSQMSRSSSWKQGAQVGLSWGVSLSQELYHLAGKALFHFMGMKLLKWG